MEGRRDCGPSKRCQRNRGGLWEESQEREAWIEREGRKKTRTGLEIPNASYRARNLKNKILWPVWEFEVNPASAWTDWPGLAFHSAALLRLVQAPNGVQKCIGIVSESKQLG